MRFVPPQWQLVLENICWTLWTGHSLKWTEHGTTPTRAKEYHHMSSHWLVSPPLVHGWYFDDDGWESFYSLTTSSCNPLPRRLASSKSLRQFVNSWRTAGHSSPSATKVKRFANGSSCQIEKKTGRKPITPQHAKKSDVFTRVKLSISGG